MSLILTLLFAETLAIPSKIVFSNAVVVFALFNFLFKRFAHTSFIKKIKNIIIGIGIGLSTIKNLKNKWQFILHSIIIWSCYISGTYIGFYAVEGTAGLPFVAAFPVLAFASLGMILTPGGIGFYPLFIMQVMALYKIDEGIGFANGTLQWLAQFVIILIMGFLCLLFLPYYNKKLNNEKYPIHTG